MQQNQLATAAICLVLMSSASAQDGTWVDPRAKPLPTDKMGPFVHTADGGVLAIDDAASYVSTDGGKTWSDPRPLFPDGLDIKVSNERSVFRTRERVIIAAFMNLAERHWTWSDELGDAPAARLPTYVMRSLDDGKTWQDVQKLHDDWTGAIRDMIQTTDGRVIFTAMKMRHDPGRHAVLTYSSTDGGETWKASNLIDLGGAGHHGGVTEPTLTQLKDGRVWMLIRTNWGEFWSAYSRDGGQFWQIIQPSGIPASSAPGLIKRLASGRLMLVWNRPYPDGKTEWPLSGGDNRWSATPVSNHREELSIAWSEDDGQTWSAPVVIAHKRDRPGGASGRWVSYPYVFEHEPGELWITTMQGGLRIVLHESSLLAKSTPRTDKQTTIVAFGDSTTARRGDLSVYAGVLQQELGPRGLPVGVINAGVGGNHTGHARDRIEEDVLAHDPDVVIIQFGINDAAIDVWKTPPATLPRVALETYAENLRGFIQTLKARNTRVVLMTPNPLRWTPKTLELYGKAPYRPDDVNGFNLMLSKYAEATRRLSKEETVTLVDVYQIFEEYGEKSGRSVDDLLLDGMHPNDRGHWLIADRLIGLFTAHQEDSNASRNEATRPTPPLLSR